MLQCPILNGIIAPFWRMNARLIWRRFAMADVVYVVLGLLFFGLMGLYATACNRL
jgi:hypothetical protein